MIYLFSNTFFNFRDELFMRLCQQLKYQSTSNRGKIDFVAIKTPSLHLFSVDDTVVDSSASIEAMDLFHDPEMKIRSGDHEPGCEESVEILEMSIKNLWEAKFGEKIRLEGD
jgi:hypothetical protein